VLLGNGDGTFHPAAATLMAGELPAAVIAADFNNDQKLDLAVSNLDGTVSIFLGNGDGSFQTAMNFAAGYDSLFLAAGDFNGDGKLDLAVADQSPGLVAILTGIGDGTFGPPAFYASDMFPTTLVLTDFNNDGNLDVVVGLGTADYIGPNQPTNTLDVLLGNGDGTFQGTRLLPTGQNSRGLAIADLNADGKPDVVVANQDSGDLSVFLGQGNGKFQALPSSSNTSGFGGPVSVAAADFNGDGKADIATVEQSAQSVAISLGNGDGTFQAPSVLAAGTTPVFAAEGDLNGDGKPDLVVADNGPQDPCSPDEGAVLVFLSNGLTFQAVKRFAAGSHPTSVAIKDVNLDGKPDLVVSDGGQFGASNTGGESVLLGNGDGTFQTPLSYTTGVTTGLSVAVADINGDGKPDLVVPAIANNFKNEVLIFLGKGDGTFLTPISLTASQPDANVIVGDFNGDGKPDLLLANCCGDTSMSYFLGKGNGTFQSEALFNGGTFTEFVASADFNDDGKPDLAIANAPMNSGGLTILLNTTPPPPVNMTANPGTTPQSAAAGSAFANALAVTVTDSSGHPVAGVSVRFTAPSSGASGKFAGGAATFTISTNSSGLATAAAFTANATSGTYAVTATSAGLPTVGFALTNTSLPPANMTANSGTTPQSAAAGSAFANALAVTVTDNSGNPVAGVSVAFAAPSSGASGTFAGGAVTFTTSTNSSGVATAAAFTANATSGTYTVTATSAGLPTVGFALTNTATTHPAFFSGEIFLSGIVYYLQFPDSNLFGYYEYLSSSILYHFDMGYEAFIPGTGSQIYFYDFGSGHWWYTSSSLFPYIYDFSLSTFIYYFPSTTNPDHYTTNPRYFSNLTTDMIFSM
jgi:hypothetical protein